MPIQDVIEVCLLKRKETRDTFSEKERVLNRIYSGFEF